MIKKENKYLIYDTPKKINIIYIFKNIFYFIVSMFYRLSFLLNRPTKKRYTKYQVSICAIFKDEAPYIKEWIEFHKIVGVEHFYMYNNFSSDNYMDVLSPYIERGDVTLIDWPVPQGQMKAYKDCIEKCMKNNVLNRAFDMQIDKEIYANILKEYEQHKN